MLTRDDIRGVCALPPTPCKEGAGTWAAEDSVDLDTTATVTEQLIQAGVGSIALCGTTGECAALLWEEKREYIATVVEVARKRVPILAGATALGTKEVIRQMKGLKGVGADAAFVGLPLWQTPTLENSVQFYADLGEAMPDMPVTVYANIMYFKSMFPTEFWDGLAKKAPTVIAAKMSHRLDHYVDDLRVAGHQINLVPGENSVYQAYKLAGKDVTCCWSTSVGMGPEPIVALMDAVARADGAAVDAIHHELESLPPIHPPDVEFFKEFPKYNAQAAKYRSNAAGFAKFGPSRPPYQDLPDGWKWQIELNAAAWRELRKKYTKTGAAS